MLITKIIDKNKRGPGNKLSKSSLSLSVWLACSSIKMPNK